MLLHWLHRKAKSKTNFEAHPLLIVFLPGTASVNFPRSVESVCPATPRMMPRCGSTEWQWSVVRSNHFCVPESKIRFSFERAPVTFHLFDLTSSATKLVSVATCASSDAECELFSFPPEFLGFEFFGFFSFTAIGHIILP